MKNKKIILDACCGGRIFWFNKNHPNVLYIDNRIVQPYIVGKGKNARIFSCLPDRKMDFRKMKIKSNTFSLVVFDPPHFVSAGKTGYMGQKYGSLDPKMWREDIRKGFTECFRVLKKGGVLVFKWNEHSIRLREILKLAPVDPLFGHPSGKRQKTHWIVFMKI